MGRLDGPPMRKAHASRTAARQRLRARARRFAAWLLLLGGLLHGLPAQVQVSGQLSCPASRVAGGHDYQGLVLTLCSFNGLDLRKANFTGAQLTAVVFVRTNLAGADFSNATFVDSQSATFPTDFSFADLTDASSSAQSSPARPT